MMLGEDHSIQLQELAVDYIQGDVQFIEYSIY